MELPTIEIRDIVEKLHNWEDHIPNYQTSNGNIPIEDLNKFDALYKEISHCNDSLRAFARAHAHDLHLQPKLDKELHEIIQAFFKGPQSDDLIRSANVISGVYYNDPYKFANQLQEFEKLINQISAPVSASA